MQDILFSTALGNIAEILIALAALLSLAMALYDWIDK